MYPVVLHGKSCIIEIEIRLPSGGVLLNRVVGKVGAAVTGLAVLAFALSMVIAPSIYVSCFASMFIAIGFVPFMCAMFAVNKQPKYKAVGYTGIAFSAVYAVIILMVYYAECTTVRMNTSLSEEALSIISYGHLGSLFFNYDLLGYAFMGMSTFLIGFTVQASTKPQKVLQWMLWLHGVFFFSGLLMPLFPVFKADTSSAVGTIILEIWCLYFLPVCVLGYRYFQNGKE